MPKVSAYIATSLAVIGAVTTIFFGGMLQNELNAIRTELYEEMGVFRAESDEIWRDMISMGSVNRVRRQYGGYGASGSNTGGYGGSSSAGPSSGGYGGSSGNGPAPPLPTGSHSQPPNGVPPQFQPPQGGSQGPQAPHQPQGGFPQGPSGSSGSGP
uniref:Nematode cuticle collagen N-terminal domain-containing protein n=1 Tax=Panagrolaimus sp. JU765 TaxID=591449 RepID=A0AC34R2I5_9BILA